jgi:hypothetical protein
MNWGHKITIVIVVFLTAMLGMVYLASRQTNEMIDEKYYEKEMAYQELINAKENLQQVTTKSLVSQSDSELIIQLPAALAAASGNGISSLIRNENRKMDLQYPFGLAVTGKQVLNKSRLQKGWYLLRVRWKSNGREYFAEENINILK